MTLVAALFSSAALLGPVTSADAAYPGRNGALVAAMRSLDGGAGSGIYTIRPGSRLRPRRMPGTRAADSFPLWSPTGRELAVSRTTYPPNPDADPASETEVWIMNASGGGQRQVVDLDYHDPCGSTPASAAAGWTPDGRALVYVSDRFTGEDDSDPTGYCGGWAWGVGVDGTGNVLLSGYVPGRTSMTEGVLSPDASRLAFRGSLGSERNLSLLVLDLSTGAIRRLASGSPDVNDIDWSPDGRRIAFTRDNGRMYVMQAAGGGLRLLARTIGELAWSPDGRRIAYLGKAPVRTRQSGVRFQAKVIRSISPTGGRSSVLSYLYRSDDVEMEELNWQPRP